MAPEPSPPLQLAGAKRPHSSTTPHGQIPHKKRRVTHALLHVQSRPADIEPASQDPVFAQGQLLKSIGAALKTAGFDGAHGAALEMFRSHAEEFMLHFLAEARAAMHNSRRTRPTPIDFAKALAHTPTTSTASLLAPQLKWRIPRDISCPQITGPNPAPVPAPDFNQLLQPLIDSRPPSFIPRHFPLRPPSHAWQQTPVFPERERDPKKMREKATAEGMLAEQALRRLAAAAKSGAMNAEKRRHSALVDDGKTRGPTKAHKRARQREDTFADVLKEIGGTDETTDVALAAEANQGSVDLGMPEGIAVNYDMSHWRRAGARHGMWS